jgi:hypothetical protein
VTDRNWQRVLNLPQIVLLALCAVLLLTVVVAGIGTPAPFASYNTDWTGTSDLRTDAIADENTTVAIDSPVTTPPPVTAKTTALVLDVPNETAIVETTAADVLANGGTVVITNEVPAPTNTLLEALGATVRVQSGPVRDPESYYRQPVLPIATMTNATGEPAETELTLNHAGTLAPGNAAVLARTSQLSYVDRNGNEQFDTAESLAARPVMTQESVGNGTVVVISDSSVFINVMYDRGGNRGLAQWLYAESDTLVLTGSAVRPLPRLVTVLLWLKSTPISQLVLLSGSTGILLLATRAKYRSALVSRFRRETATETRSPDNHTQSEGASEPAYESGLMSLLRRTHPEWDRETLRRLVTASVTRRRQHESAPDAEDTTDE